MSRILVVDDKAMMRDSVAETLARRGHAVETAASAVAAVDRLAGGAIDVLVTDLQMPGMDGLELLAKARSIDDDVPVVVMTAYGTVETAVVAMRQGAFDYVTKPFSGEELVVTVERAVEHRSLRRENELLRVTTTAAARGSARERHEMIGSSSAMNELRDRLARMADSSSTLLLLGESGSGKEVAARFVHDQSPRARAPFLALNCAALSAGLLESELFGHERGAFTGADSARQGRFELADGGTLLLDEISEIPLETQAKLLRVLQEKCFDRVGSSRSRTVDVRVIATTNRDLSEEVAAGRFRADLFYRLNVLPAVVPPLRERRGDVPELARHFLRRLASRDGGGVRHMSVSAVALLEEYGWPGNVRELQNVCERAAVLSSGSQIDSDLIGPWLSGPANGTPSAPMVCDGMTTLGDVERAVIVATLRHNEGHRRRSAKALGIGVRTLGLKLKKWKEQNLVAESL